MPKNIDIELKSFPIELTKAYSSSKKSISKILNQDQIEEWTNIGLKIAHVRKGVRSWELAVKFYQVSPSVSKLIPYNYFYEWMQQVLLISNKSKPIADSFFSNSPKTVSILRSRHLEEWVKMGLELYTGIWKSTNLATTFFQPGDQLLRRPGQVPGGQLGREGRPVPGVAALHGHRPRAGARLAIRCLYCTLLALCSQRGALTAMSGGIDIAAGAHIFLERPLWLPNAALSGCQMLRSVRSSAVVQVRSAERTFFCKQNAERT